MSLTGASASHPDSPVGSSAPRPLDLVVPSPQSAHVLLVYGNRLLDVPFSVSCELNPIYEASPGAGQCGPDTATLAVQLASGNGSALRPSARHDSVCKVFPSRQAFQALMAIATSASRPDSVEY